MYGRGYQNPGMGIGPPVTPPVVKRLLIANAVAYVMQLAFGRTIDINFGLIPAAVFQYGYVWQPFTYMWLHGSLGHIAMNMFVLWMFGSQLALVWGARRFIKYYLICGIGAGFFIAIVPYLPALVGQPINPMIPTLGASGAIYGVVLAYSLTWPDRTIMLIFPPVAFKAIWIIPVMFFMTLMMGGGNISHTGHLGGVVVGWLYMRRRGDAGSLFSFGQLKARWHRYRMRRRLRAVQFDEYEDRRNRNRSDRTFH